ncbi:hypothetical protein PCANC_24725 [Puccinia coronata f. sp. avenae]|uniref:Uncharacterized protein n=1 Tax=Puccinia coronata f. sp. avenae TaxID=200324 RepID=A0A2N5S3P6_9BASI|nr:hypothetical protein PCANC_24725 [Puccinia coronata f. sp. avenae]PLW12421.1 hypothetical protein PCASD_21417 [Puccinia coronata f. sp. avenae]
MSSEDPSLGHSLPLTAAHQGSTRRGDQNEAKCMGNALCRLELQGVPSERACKPTRGAVHRFLS